MSDIAWGPTSDLYFFGPVSINQNKPITRTTLFNPRETDKFASYYAEQFSRGNWLDIVFEHVDQLPIGRIIMIYRCPGDHMGVVGHISGSTPAGRRVISDIRNNTRQGLSLSLDADFYLDTWEPAKRTIFHLGVVRDPCWHECTWIKYYFPRLDDLLITFNALRDSGSDASAASIPAFFEPIFSEIKNRAPTQTLDFQEPRFDATQELRRFLLLENKNSSRNFFPSTTGHHRRILSFKTSHSAEQFHSIIMSTTTPPAAQPAQGGSSLSGQGGLSIDPISPVVGNVPAETLKQIDAEIGGRTGGTDAAKRASEQITPKPAGGTNQQAPTPAAAAAAAATPSASNDAMDVDDPSLVLFKSMSPEERRRALMLNEGAKRQKVETDEQIALMFYGSEKYHESEAQRVQKEKELAELKAKQEKEAAERKVNEERLALVESIAPKDEVMDLVPAEDKAFVLEQLKIGKEKFIPDANLARIGKISAAAGRAYNDQRQKELMLAMGMRSNLSNQADIIQQRINQLRESEKLAQQSSSSAPSATPAPAAVATPSPSPSPSPSPAAANSEQPRPVVNVGATASKGRVVINALDDFISGMNNLNMTTSIDVDALQRRYGITTGDWARVPTTV